MRPGMRVVVRLPNPSRAKNVGVSDERLVGAIVLRPFTDGAMADCTDVRLADGEERMVHSSRITLPLTGTPTTRDA